MDKKLKNDRFLRVIFNNDELLVVDVNNSDIWEKILNQKNRITKIETQEWIWDLSNGEVVFR